MNSNFNFFNYYTQLYEAIHDYKGSWKQKIEQYLGIDDINDIIKKYHIKTYSKLATKGDQYQILFYTPQDTNRFLADFPLDNIHRSAYYDSKVSVWVNPPKRM